MPKIMHVDGLAFELIETNDEQVLAIDAILA